MHHASSHSLRTPIAVVAASALFPGRSGLAGFWQDILEGRDLIRPVPHSYWKIDDYYDPDPKAADKTYAKSGSFLEPFKFNPLDFGLPPAQLPATDTTQIFALVLARAILDQMAETLGEEGLKRDRIGVILGVASATELVTHLGARLQRPIWEKALREAGLPEDQVHAIGERITAHYVPWQEASFPGLLGNVVAGRVANRFNLGGSNYVTDAACASSLAAIQAGVNELLLGQADSVLCGGIDAINDIFMYMCFSKTPALSPTGHARPFSADADGTILGEGGGMVLLRRLDDAERDRNQILAIVTGIGQGSDGKGTAIYAPKVEGQARTLRRAYEWAGFGPDSVELVEAHGTATNAGDATELKALQDVYGPAAEGGGPWCALGSVKSQIGHTKAAAGLAGLLKAALSLHHKVLPPTIKVDQPSKALKADSAFYLNTECRPWIRGSDHPRRAAVSAFGFGGSNFHVALEEYSGPAAIPSRLRTQAHELFLFAGSDVAAVASAITKAAETLAQPYDRFNLAADREWAVRAQAQASQQSFDCAQPVRVALVVAVAEGMEEAARRVVQSLQSAGLRSLQGPGFAIEIGVAEPGRIAFLFPGQGSQSLGMAGALAIHLEAARAVWDRAASHPCFATAPLHRLVFPVPSREPTVLAAQESALADQRVVQPALAAASLSYLRVIESVGVKSDCVAGHSFGELTALCAAGVLSESAYLHAAAERGRTMFEAGAGGSGGMTAISASAAAVQALMATAGEGLTLSNDNAPEQVVVSGPLEALDRLESRAIAQGLRATRLKVSTALHSPMVAPACAPFIEALSTLPFETPEIPVYNNDLAAPYPVEPEAIRSRLGAAPGRPVRFRQMLEAMDAAGVRTFLEVGPGTTLTNLGKACLGQEKHRFIALGGRDAQGLEALLLGLGRLALAGCRPDLEILWQESPLPARPILAGPTTVAVTGSNIGKPYPGPDPLTVAPPAPLARDEQVSRPARPPALSPSAASLVAVPEPTTKPQTVPPVAEDPEIDVPLNSEEFQILARIQAQLAESHQRFQETMFQSQQSFVKSSVDIVRRMTGGLSSDTLSGLDLPHETGPRAAAPIPASQPVPQYQPVSSPVARVSAVSAPPPAIVPPPAPPQLPIAVADYSPAASSEDLLTVVTAIVAEKTGYPADMLEPGMDLEGDLGIDSIKQVEILSALRDRMPHLPEIDPAQLSSLRTLGQIAGHLQGGSGETEKKTLPLSV